MSREKKPVRASAAGSGHWVQVHSTPSAFWEGYRYPAFSIVQTSSLTSTDSNWPWLKCLVKGHSAIYTALTVRYTAHHTTLLTLLLIAISKIHFSWNYYPFKCLLLASTMRGQFKPNVISTFHSIPHLPSPHFQISGASSVKWRAKQNLCAKSRLAFIQPSQHSGQRYVSNEASVSCDTLWSRSPFQSLSNYEADSRAVCLQGLRS